MAKLTKTGGLSRMVKNAFRHQEHYIYRRAYLDAGPSRAEWDRHVVLLKMAFQAEENARAEAGLPHDVYYHRALVSGSSSPHLVIIDVIPSHVVRASQILKVLPGSWKRLPMLDAGFPRIQARFALDPFTHR